MEANDEVREALGPGDAWPLSGLGLSLWVRWQPGFEQRSGII